MTEFISLVLDSPSAPTGRVPQLGESVPVARWLSSSSSIAAVLMIRHRRDQTFASEIAIAVRQAHGTWRDLDLGSGAGGYPNVFTERPHDAEAAILGTTETWLSEADTNAGRGMPLTLMELFVGASITSVVCETATGPAEQEVSPSGLVLVGALSERATVGIYQGTTVVRTFRMSPTPG
ncbi:hypothetical protein ACIBHX_43920 [Nonomuraea sp. NPDC050536]|uniref:hypothetical protein n=1 Tax=Nonomuraea sp. NPDC050536 TaxID=3364366 RepID=UPI0037C7887D